MCPVRSFGQWEILLIRHLEKEQVGDLLDVIPVVDAVMPQRVAEAPEFGCNVGHAAATSRFRSLSRSASLPLKSLLARPQPPRFARTGMSSHSCRSIER